MKVNRLQRILRLLTAIQAERYFKPGELAEKLGISRRTVFRDLDILYKAGIPCYYDDDKGGYKIDRRFFLPPLQLTLSEAMALMLVAQFAGEQGGLPLQQEAHLAAMKIASMLPAHIQQQCGATLKTVSARLPAPARHLQLDQTLMVLQKAITQRRQVEITYISFAEQKQINLTLQPYHLHFDCRAWYVIGYSNLHKAVRTFKLGRIKKAEALASHYSLEKPFRLADYFGDAWSMIPEGKIYQTQLRFSPLVAGNVAEVLWHPRQKITWHDDGSITFEVEVDGLGEITWWLLGYGNQVEVIKPVQLRQRVGQIARKMLRLYLQT